MKKIGLIGGISWTSTIDYYRYINEGVNKRLGGLHFAECIIYSLNFGDVQEKTWENAFGLLLHAGESLQKSGADALVLCANTAHLYAEQLQQKIPLPLIHIVTETAKAVKNQGLKKIGVLGTKFTMEMDFYRNTLEANGLEVLLPSSQATRDYIQHTVKEELGRGIVRPATKQRYLSIIKELAASGAEGIILGCTEMPLLLGQEDIDLPVFDTTKIHAAAIVEYMFA
jgi:aspartate racemase